MIEETTELHPNAGAAGAIGAHGDLGANAAGSEARPAPAVTGSLRPHPATGIIVEVPVATDAKPAFVAATAEAQIVEALVNAGFTAEESVAMAQCAIAELESRKGK